MYPELAIPMLVPKETGAVFMAASSGGSGGGGNDDESWRYEGVVRARWNDMMSGVGKVFRRLGRFINRAMNLEFGGAIVGVGGAGSIAYGTSLIVMGGLSVTAGLLVVGGAAAVVGGYLLWRAGRWLSNRVDGVAARTFVRQAERRTRDYL